MQSNAKHVVTENTNREDPIYRIIFIRREQVERITGMSRAWIYQAMAENRFPRPVTCSPGSRRWLLSEVQEFMEQKIQDRNTKAQSSNA